MVRLAWAVLEELRLTPGAHDPERTQLWPGHDEPYLCVGAWGDVDSRDRFWNETAFNRASLEFADLAASGAPPDLALTLFHRGFVKLSAAAYGSGTTRTDE